MENGNINILVIFSSFILMISFNILSYRKIKKLDKLKDTIIDENNIKEYLSIKTPMILTLDVLYLVLDIFIIYHFTNSYILTFVFFFILVFILERIFSNDYVKYSNVDFSYDINSVLIVFEAKEKLQYLKSSFALYIISMIIFIIYLIELY